MRERKERETLRVGGKRGAETMYAVWKRFYIVGIRGIHLQKESESAEAGCTEVSLVHFLFCRCFMVNFPSHDFEQPQILTGVNTVCLFAHTNTCTEKHTHICMHKISITLHNINKNTTVHTHTNTKKYTNLFLWPTHTHTWQEALPLTHVIYTYTHTHALPASLTTLTFFTLKSLTTTDANLKITLWAASTISPKGLITCQHHWR